MSSAPNAVAGCLAFPAPSAALGRYRPGPRGIPGSFALGWRRAPLARNVRPVVVALRGLAPLLQSAHLLCRNSSQLPKKPRAPPLFGFALFRPSTDRPSVRSLPEAEASFGSTVLPVEIAFRPRGFSPPRRFTPHRGCEFVAPRCRLWGSARFLLPASRSARRLPGGPSHFPRRVSYPSKSSPHQQPYRITAAVALVSFLPALLARTRSTEAERAGRSPVAEATSSLPGAFAGRGPLWRIAPPWAEAVGGAIHPRRPKPSPVPCVAAGRSLWFRAGPPSA